MLHVPPLPHDVSRREMIRRCTMGFGSLGLLGTLAADGRLLADQGSSAAGPLAPKAPHFAPKAKRVVHFFFNGGMSQVDTFDHKPSLEKYDGKPVPLELKTERRTGAAMRSPFAFAPAGQCGKMVSEIFPELAKQADDLCFVHSMQADVPNHEPSLMLMNCGDARLPRPSVGSWVTYGLGTENQNLPGFVVLVPGGYPIAETTNWQNGFLPGVYQGNYIDTTETRPDRLIAHLNNPTQSRSGQRRQLDLLQKLNAEHSRSRGPVGEEPLESRIQSFELAYRMQMEATDAFDVANEPKAIHELYGGGVHGRQALIARRLLERGVRYIQLWHGADQPWDSHDDLAAAHRGLARQADRPIAGLIQDLKQRGMLDDTLIVCCGEFGRTPTVEMPTPGSNQGKVNGRDHNHYGFTVLLAGGGVKGGFSYGATDEFGFQAVENPVHVHDLHATMLHLLGFDHEKLTYRYAGRDFRLTDVHGHVVRDILA